MTVNIVYPIFDQMAEAITNCRASNREPKLFIVTHHIEAILMQQCSLFHPYFLQNKYAENSKGTVFGIPVFVNDNVTDFILVDDRSWVDQKF